MHLPSSACNDGNGSVVSVVALSAIFGWAKESFPKEA